MKRGRIPLWLLRDLPALIGVAWSFWPLMIMVIANGRRAMRGRAISPHIYEALMQMLPIAEARLRFALHRQAYRALGWNPRAIALEQILPITSWSDFAARFEAYRATMQDLPAAAAFFLTEHRRRHRIRTSVDANTVRAAHASTDARSAATHEAVGVFTISNGRVALIPSSDRRERPSKDEGVLQNARGPPLLPIRYSLLPQSLSAPTRLRTHLHARLLPRAVIRRKTPRHDADTLQDTHRWAARRS